MRARLEESGRTGADLASRVGLSPSQMSRSLSGGRRFSTVELAQVADELGVSLYWLVTGEPDPMEVKIAARHAFDSAARTYLPNGLDADQQVLEDIALLYRQAYR